MRTAILSDGSFGRYLAARLRRLKSTLYAPLAATIGRNRVRGSDAIRPTKNVATVTLIEGICRILVYLFRLGSKTAAGCYGFFNGTLAICHVLIIEDEPFFAMDLQSVLELVGASSFAFADTHKEAVAAALAQKPAVITSDVMLL
jgi:hypothetical protein